MSDEPEVRVRNAGNVFSPGYRNHSWRCTQCNAHSSVCFWTSDECWDDLQKHLDVHRELGPYGV